MSKPAVLADSSAATAYRVSQVYGQPARTPVCAATPGSRRRHRRPRARFTAPLLPRTVTATELGR